MPLIVSPTCVLLCVCVCVCIAVCVCGRVPWQTVMMSVWEVEVIPPGMSNVSWRSVVCLCYLLCFLGDHHCLLLLLLAAGTVVLVSKGQVVHPLYSTLTLALTSVDNLILHQRKKKIIRRMFPLFIHLLNE